MLLRWLTLVPVVAGSLYAILCVPAVLRFRRRRPRAERAEWPPVTILKPVCGLDKDLAANTRTACEQDYPDYQVILSVQRPDDPALPVLLALQRELGPERVTVVVESCHAGSNGKVNNLVGALRHARHDVLVISDSDVRLAPDYLRTIVAPLDDPGVGAVCTLYRGARAERWFERLELLTLNADFVPSVIFAETTGATRACVGASMAIRRSTLEASGGLEGLADSMVEDFELGRRLAAAGRKVVLLPYLVETMVDLGGVGSWWDHQVYWDQNTRAARPWGFFATVLVRAVPFAFLFALLGGGFRALLWGLAIRLASAGVILGPGLGDREGLRALPLLPLRDLAGMATWVVAQVRRTTVWRGKRLNLSRDGRVAERAAPAGRRLIVTADDFGLAVPVNEAVEAAARDGVLRSASLMVGAPAAADAVARARRTPALRVGLHVVVADGRPVLPPAAIPGLVDARGQLRSGLVGAGLRFYFLPGVRRQLAAEIRAQFEAFRATGLPLDHVDAHHHLHLHPVVAALTLRIGREYGMAAMRVPAEPPLRAWRASGRGLAGRLAAAAFLAPWLALLRRRVRRAGLRANDAVFGLSDSGRMTRELLLRLVARLPAGVTEIYLHPAVPGDRGEAELAALLDPALREALEAAGVELASFGDLAGRPPTVRRGARSG